MNCTVCSDPVYQRGYCRKHYMRWYRHGDPLVVKPRGLGIHGLPPERQYAIRVQAGRKGGSAKAKNFAARAQSRQPNARKHWSHLWGPRRAATQLLCELGISFTSSEQRK